MFFRVFELDGQKLLSRAWLIDPGQTQAIIATASAANAEKEPWNGEFYVSFGDMSSRSWEDASKYGYISGGGGTWSSQTLKLLSPGDRVWVKIPKQGYVGVGKVVEPVQPASEFQVSTPTGMQSVVDVVKHGEKYKQDLNNPELGEYFVRVAWLDQVDAKHAFNELGLFGNQNTVCRPTTPKWRTTVDRLKTHFKNWDNSPAPADNGNH